MSNEVIELCQKLVALPSVNPQDAPVTTRPYCEKQMADFVYNWLDTHNLKPQRQQAAPGRENVVAIAEGADKSKTLLLSAHMDTVDVKDMTIDPFDPQLRDGRIYGRGSCDTKGPMAAIMIAFRDRAQQGNLPYNLVFLATCGEEYDTLGSGYYAEQHGSEITAAVFAEPTELKVITAHKGIVRLKLTCHGQSAHSSTPHLGDNAIYTMAEAIGTIKQYSEKLSAQSPNESLGTETISVTIINGGQQINVVPDKCDAKIDWRVLPGRRPQRCRDELLDFLKTKTGSDKMDLELVSVYQPMHTDDSHPIISALLDAAKKTIGQSQTAAVPYGTDASPFARFGIPTAIFGPGSAAQAHTKDEFIETDQLQKGLDAYKTFLQADWGI